MHQAHVFELGMLADTLAVEAREQRGRAGPVETLVVIEDPYPHKSFPLRSNLSPSRIVQNTAYAKRKVNTNDISGTLCQARYRRAAKSGTRSAPLQPLICQQLPVGLLLGQVADDRQLEHLVLIRFDHQENPERQFSQSEQAPDAEHQHRNNVAEERQRNVENDQRDSGEQALERVEAHKAIAIVRLNQQR